MTPLAQQPLPISARDAPSAWLDDLIDSLGKRIQAGEVVDAGDDHVVYRMRDGGTWVNDARAEAVAC